VLRSPSSRPRTRLHVATDLGSGAIVELAPGQAHQVRSVLRLSAGDAVALFNGRDGEWLGRIDVVDKRGVAVALERQLRRQEAEPDLWLLFAPVKRAGVDLVAEKATELGVSALLPVITERTQAERVKTDRLLANAIEAAEQSERLTVPEVREPERLVKLLAGWNPERHLVLCDESGTAPPLAAVAAGLPAGRPLAVLVGPEGGFSRAELDALGKLAFVSAAALGPRVLRAETAALAALAVVQALAGDWRQSRPR
jgi:16S rRNA (uracil1498-N3)-methyltransferase